MIVLTSVTGGKDNLIHDQVKGKAKWTAFTDFDFKSDTWERQQAYDKFTSPRRNSRVPKILTHQFVDTDYSLWIDGNLKLLIPPEELLIYLKDHDIAMFKHPTRDCLYDEAMECARQRLDDPETIINQVKKYEVEGFGKNRGLCEGGFILRRHTERVERFNNAWWSEYSRHSVRDQVSMFYALDKAGLTINQIDLQFINDNGRFIRGSIVEMVGHLTPRPE